MSAPRESRPESILALEHGWKRDRHVLKHLYRRSERWDMLFPDLPPGLRRRALDAGCACIDEVQRGSERRYRIPEEGRARLREDHDRWYLPGYMDAIETAQAAGRVFESGTDRLFLAGDNGVLVIARQGRGGKHPRVVTAYRNVQGDPEQRTQQDFVDEVHRLWKDKKDLATNPSQDDDSEET